LICEGCSQISELFHHFRLFINYLYVVILSGMLVPDMTMYLSFLSIYFYTIRLTGD